MSFDNLMESFAKQNDLGELDFHDNKYHLVLDGNIEVACFQANGHCYLRGMLAPMPDNINQQEALMTKLLQTSLSLIHSQRVTLCINPETHNFEVYLMRKIQGLDELELSNALVEYINCFEIFKKECELDSIPSASMPIMLMP